MQKLPIFTLLFVSVSISSCGLLSDSSTSSETPSCPAGSSGWTPMSTLNAPLALSPGFVWTGSKLVIWGGRTGAIPRVTDTGAIYDPSSDFWETISTTGAPSARSYASLIWTGNEVIVWGGSITKPNTDPSDPQSIATNTGAAYNPSTRTWRTLSTTSAPLPMTLHRAFWTGTEMLVFGGIPGTDDGNYDSGLYNPTTDTWRHPSIQGQPSQRDHLSATWDGTEMIVYGGGQGSHFFNDAYAYHPGKDQWRTLTSAPVSRRSHASIFSSGLMYVWGGHSIDGTTLTYENSGYLYNTANNSWEKLTETSAPALNFESSLVATSNGFIAWGGQGNNQGGIYNNITKSWTSISTQDAPSGRSMSAIAWTGCKLMIWGGPKVDGAIYTP